MKIKNQSPSGISRRATLALAVIVASLLCSGILLGISFFRISNLFDTIRQTRMNNLTAAFALIRESERIESLTSEIVMAQNYFIRTSLVNEVMERRKTWLTLIEGIRETAVAKDVAMLRGNLTLLYQRKQHLYDLIQKQILLREKTGHQRKRLLVLSSRLDKARADLEPDFTTAVSDIIHLEKNALIILLGIQSLAPEKLERFRAEYEALDREVRVLMNTLPPAAIRPVRQIHREVAQFAAGSRSLFTSVETLARLRQDTDDAIVENTFITNRISTAAGRILQKLQGSMTTDMDTVADQFKISTILFSLFGGISILLALITLFYLRRFVVARLLRLSKEILLIAEETAKEPGRTVPVDGRDEIGVLAGSINSALKEIYLRETGLINSRKELEALVEERTAMLNNKNIDLLKEIRERKSAQIALENSKEELQALSDRLLESHEEERRRLAAELHDDIAPSLGSIKFGLETAMAGLENLPAQKERLTSIVGVVKSVAAQLEHIRHALRPSMLDDLGVIESLDWYCNEFSDIYQHIQAQFSIMATEKNIPEALKIVLFRVVQEALNNVAKHSNAKKAEISLISEADTLQLIIRDNGRGFNSRKAKQNFRRRRQGFGLVSMQERVEAAGGSFVVRSSEGRGVYLSAFWSNLMEN